MSSQADPEKIKVYEFENELEVWYPGSAKKLSLKECQDLVNKICSMFLAHPPLVVDGKGRKCATTDTLWMILPVKYRNQVSVIHESAHVVVRSLPDWDGGPSHGPMFRLYFMEIFSRIVDGCRFEMLEHYLQGFSLRAAPRENFICVSSQEALEIEGLLGFLQEKQQELAEKEQQLAEAREFVESFSASVDLRLKSCREKLEDMRSWSSSSCPV